MIVGKGSVRLYGIEQMIDIIIIDDIPAKGIISGSRGKKQDSVSTETPRKRNAIGPPATLSVEDDRCVGHFLG